MEIKPDIISLSGLLTIAHDSMKEIVQLVKNLEDAELSKTPIIIGGGTINEMVCGFVGADYWAADAMVGVQLCKQIMGDNHRQLIILDQCSGCIIRTIRRIYTTPTATRTFFAKKFLRI